MINNPTGVANFTQVFIGNVGGAYSVQGSFDPFAPDVQTLNSPDGKEQIIVQNGLWYKFTRWNVVSYLGMANKIINPSKSPSLFGLTWGKLGIFLLAGIAIFVVAKQSPDIIAKLSSKSGAKA